jgi:hypothetical protein
MRLPANQVVTDRGLAVIRGPQPAIDISDLG